MKKALVLAGMLMLSLQIFAQHFTPKSRYERQLSKSRERRTAAVIFLGAGAAVTTGGMLLFNNGLADGDVKSVLGFFLTGVGIGSMCTSIPFFVGAHKARKRAMRMSMKTENTSLLYKTGFSMPFYPALAFQIPLGR